MNNEIKKKNELLLILFFFIPTVVMLNNKSQLTPVHFIVARQIQKFLFKRRRAYFLGCPMHYSFEKKA